MKFPPPASAAGDLDLPLTQTRGRSVSPHADILERKCLLNNVLFLSAQHGTTSIARYEANAAFSAQAMICPQSCFNCVWDAGEFKVNDLKLSAFLKRSLAV